MEGWLTDCNTDTNWSKYTHVIPMPIHNTAWAMERSVLSGREVSDHHRIMPPGQSAKLIHWPACLAQSALRIVTGGPALRAPPHPALISPFDILDGINSYGVAL